MRKHFLLFFLLLASCTQIPEKTLDNTKCEDIKEVFVLQVMEHHILGWVDNPPSDSVQQKYGTTNDHIIYLLKEPGQVYYPKQKISFNEPLCLVYNGVYRYQKSNSEEQTFLISSLEPNKTANPDYLIWLNKNPQELLEQKAKDLNKKEKKLNEREKYLETSSWIERRIQQKLSKHE